jgi:hypothetical protein
MWREDQRYELPGEPLQQRRAPIEYDAGLNTWHN